MLVQCPHCHRFTFDMLTGECSSCHLHGATEPNDIDDGFLEQLLHNVQLMIDRLRHVEFQQLAGAFGPHSGSGDAMAFTERQCQTVYRYLCAHDVLCEWIEVTVDRRTKHSLILAKHRRGLRRGMTAARRAVRVFHGVLTVRSSPIYTKFHEPPLNTSDREA